MGVIVIFSLIHFPMFAHMRHALIPVDSETYKFADVTSQTELKTVFLALDDATRETSADPATYAYHAKLTIDTTLTFAAYTIGAVAFWGSFIFLFFLSTGLVAVPFNQIIQWADSPKPMKDVGEFKKEKERVAKQIDWVLKSGKEIYEQKLALDEELEKGNWMTAIKLWGQQRTANVQ